MARKWVKLTVEIEGPRPNDDEVWDNVEELCDEITGIEMWDEDDCWHADLPEPFVINGRFPCCGRAPKFLKDKVGQTITRKCVGGKTKNSKPHGEVTWEITLEPTEYMTKKLGRQTYVAKMVKVKDNR